MLVAHVLKYRPGLFRGMPKFEYEIYGIPDENICMSQSGPNSFILNVLTDNMQIRAESSGWLIKSFGGGIGGGYESLDCEGTKEQITDFCLLKLRDEKKNDLHANGIKKVLRSVAGTEPNGSYEELVQKRLNEGGFRDEAEWIRSCIASNSPELAMAGLHAALKNKDEQFRDAACKVITDRNIRPDIRAHVMWHIGKGKNKNVLLAMCDVLDDTSPSYKKEYLHMLRKDYPFSEHITVKAAKPEIEKYWAKDPDTSKTVGDLAHERLKKLTKKDFGKNSRWWREWIEANVK